MVDALCVVDALCLVDALCVGDVFEVEMEGQDAFVLRVLR